METANNDNQNDNDCNDKNVFMLIFLHKLNKKTDSYWKKPYP